MDKRMLGVIYADISGTTRLHGKIGVGETQRALERCIRRIERVVDGNRGRIVMPAVDEMISVFPDGDSALQAAIEMQERVADLPPVSGIKLGIRIGVHFGPSVENGDGFSGEALEIGKKLLHIAGPSQVITCAQTAEALSPTLARWLTSLEEMSIDTPQGESQLYSVEWQSAAGRVAPAAGGASARAAVSASLAAASAAVEAPESAIAPEPTPASASPDRICVRFAGKAFLVDEKTPLLTVGRDHECDIVISDRKASRHHVRIEKRGRQRFFLIDSSTNGTFVALDGKKETLVRNEELQLTGPGRFSCGHSTANPDAEVADFEML